MNADILKTYFSIFKEENKVKKMKTQTKGYKQ